ncbi:hypothetical protein FQA39_LY05220 [Lamprigera yunnana]|nr:hypothetical protein FQA39_LY05220 [Lamprigera yunnana]
MAQERMRGNGTRGNPYDSPRPYGDFSPLERDKREREPRNGAKKNRSSPTAKREKWMKTQQKPTTNTIEATQKGPKGTGTEEVQSSRKRKARSKGIENLRDAKRDTEVAESETELTTEAPTAQLRHGIETGKQLPTTKKNDSERKRQRRRTARGQRKRSRRSTKQNGLRTPSEMKGPGPSCTDD